MKLVSIVIPVYNVEKYVSTCIDSVLKQTYKNIEVILVDDGSTDNSGKICDEYACHNKHVICLHKENGGLSDARNFGKHYCKGEYLSFIDSDDFISPYFIETMVGLLEKNAADIVALSCGVNFWDGDDMPSLAQSEFEYRSKVVSADIGLRLQLQQRIGTEAQFKVVRRSLYDDIDFPLGWVYEDLATTYRLFLNSSKVVIVDGELYAYRMRNDSIIREEFSKKKMCCIPIARQLIAEIDMSRPELHLYAVSSAFALLYSVFLQVPDSKDPEAQEIWELLLRYRDQIIKNQKHITRRKNVYGALVMFLGKKFAHYIGRRIGQKGSRKYNHTK
ncbi:MAG: glycosyltransferase family 2 protein [Butyrivibrio sp.]|nr:glycosyltransferase family 2 protein [Butyrivibrio sp.]